jgi:hypothetical protein
VTGKPQLIEAIDCQPHRVIAWSEVSHVVRDRAPELVTAAATDLANVGCSLCKANAAAVAPNPLGSALATVPASETACFPLMIAQPARVPRTVAQR